ncbi:MAG: hypothetical protein BWK80_13150 [Desulfobacteraceae bacterium IS3]|nr:MAG: hypothetical protein BWK80_13150 [Desulfobacteraceae bacterium IS3]
MRKLYSQIYLLIFLMLISGCTKTEPEYFQGYAEGEFVYISSPLGGRLEQLAVRKGQTVHSGELLFSLEQTFEAAGVRDAEELLRQAEGKLADLQKGLRPSEIEALTARLRQAESSLQLAESEYNRRAKLYKTQTVAAEERDRARSEYERENQRVKEIKSEIETARLGGRSDAVSAAQSGAESAKARLEQAQWNLKQKTRTAPKDSLVFDTFYEPEEWVAPGRPVLCLLPPENIKVRFFLPETVKSQFSVGQLVRVSFDAGDILIPATICFISTQAEYTPPIIYSAQTRAKLVFMAEALPDERFRTRLHPGQPVEVRSGK